METFRGYPVLMRTIRIGRRDYEIIGPANYDQLIDTAAVAERFARDEYLPYWAEFWPAARVMAERLLEWGPAGSAPRPTVLELGCGLGLVGLIAADLGYPTTMTDYDDDSVAFAEENIRRNRISNATARTLDWTTFDPTMEFDRIIACEVLYEDRHIAPIARFIQNHLRPGGFALVCDTGRRPADAFSEAVGACGLAVRIERDSVPRPGENPLPIRLFHVTCFAT
ncbi:MAG: class I SAM-dependent methyltransferase [Phycisphaerales bacterium]|nr:class I SAM-dependent methyltransferase [Phycisphaerales bacterium]